MEAFKLLRDYGAVYVKDVVTPELCSFLTNVLMRAPEVGYGKSTGDEQIPNAKAIVDHEIIFDTVLERVWPKLEAILGIELLPTYSYARLYTNGDELKIHKDRPACQISMTVQLGRSHHYAWPIYMGGKRYDLSEGDGVVYRGCDIDHWRDPCDGPEGYYSGQVFLHFVEANGVYVNEKSDATVRTLPESAFIKNRTYYIDYK